MNYKQIKINNKDLIVDLSKRKVRCNKCKELFNWAVDSTGKYYAIDYDKIDYHSNNCNEKFSSTFEKNIDLEDKNQDYLNSM